MKKILSCALLALSLFTSPVIPQEKTPFTIYIASHTHKGDVVAEAFVKEIATKLKHDLSEGGVLVSKDAEDSDVSGPEIVFLSAPDADGQGSVISVDVCEHVKDKPFDVLVGATIGHTTATDAVVNADQSAQYIEQATEQYEEYTAVNTDPKS